MLCAIQKMATLDRWAIYIDIQGFSTLWEYENDVLWSLGELMRGIFRLGRLCYPREPDRLFAYQFGDGFLVVSDFHERSLERCATVAVVLMRHVAASGRFARAAIVEGELSDIQGCYPREVLNCLEGDHTVSLRMGLMIINPVMGTALIRGVLAEKAAPRGPLLTIHSSKTARLGSAVRQIPIPSSKLTSIDWVHMQSDLLSEIQQKASLKSPSPSNLEMMLRNYCDQQAVPEEWRANVYELLGVPRT